MSHANLIKDKIREEFEKEFLFQISHKKVLSYLLDLLKKDKYPSLSDLEFYDIVGYTYKLNLTKVSSILSKKFGSEGVLKNAYKLNLNISFYPIYNDLKKKIRKLYGEEKWLEMEQYLINNYGLFKEEFEQIHPSIPSTNRNWKLYRDLKISAFLSELSSKEGLSYSEFFDIVGEALKSNPEFYVVNLDGEVRKRAKKLYGDEKLKEMEKYLEKFRFYDGEQILFKCEGVITKLLYTEVEPSGRVKNDLAPILVFKISGSIVVTNYRIIAQGYRYVFPIKNHVNLEKMYSNLKVVNGISYGVPVDNLIHTVQLKLRSGTSQAKVEEQLNTLFKILCKDKNQVLNIIKEYLEMEVVPKIVFAGLSVKGAVVENTPKRKQKALLIILRHLRTKEEYQDISDSEYLDIVRETYRLNPQFFMDFLYPKMKDWGSFILDAKFKAEFIELIETLIKGSAISDESPSN